jgi:hypothetical protein
MNPIYQNLMAGYDVDMMGKDAMNHGHRSLGNLGPARSEDDWFRKMFRLKVPAALDG